MLKRLVILTALVAAGVWYLGLPTYWRELQRLQSDVIDPDHKDNNAQMDQDIRAAHEGRQPNQLSMEDIEKDRQGVLPSATRAYKIDLIVREWEATAKGQTLPHPPREIRGNTWSWMQTDIPILGCMKITARGKIWRDGGTDPAAGPDGEDYFVNPLHANKTTIVPGLRWGTFIGKVCDEQDKKGDLCGAIKPIGSVAYISPNQIITGQRVGAGHLSVWTNQFGTETDRSDYNIGQGGFTFDAEPALAYMCDAVTTVANR